MTWAAKPSILPADIPTGAQIKEILDRIEALSNEVGISVASVADTTTSATYVSFAGTASVSITKVQDATRLRVDLATTAFIATGDSEGRFGVLVGGVDYDLVNWDASTLSDREGWGGFVYIPAASVPAGVYTVQLRWRRVSGAGTLTRQTSDWISLSCREVG